MPKGRERARQYLAAYIEDVKTILENELKKYGFTNLIVYGRPKHFYSIYDKMTRKDKEFNEIYDLTALRVDRKSVV